MEEFVEFGAVAGHDLGVVLGQLGQQEEAEHPALAVSAERHARFGRSTFEAIDQVLCAGTERIPKTRLGNFAQGGQAAGGGHRVAAQSAGLVHRACGGQLAHDLAWATKGRQRHAATNDLAQYREVGLEARDELGIDALRRADRHAKTRHHLVKYKQCAVFGA